MQIRAAKPADKEVVAELLQSAGLPTTDLNPALSNFLLAFVDGQLVGTAGVEVTGDYGLLRSVAVKESFRNFKIAKRLVNDLTKQMRLQWVKELYLITTTAEGYFSKQGFEKVERDAVPAEIAQSQQFSGLCPSSATVMKKSVEKPKIKLLDLEQASSCCTPNSGCC
ncbi:GNAT family N-acetyltransferase [Runella sp. SP2]|nr:GNAT family N-acetyltransferase [Runella sp. SP2]